MIEERYGAGLGFVLGLVLLALVLALAGCNSMVDASGRTQTKIDVVGIGQTFEYFSKRQTALQVEFLDPKTTEARRAQIQVQAEVERQMWMAAVEVVTKIKPVIEVRVVSETVSPGV